MSPEAYLVWMFKVEHIEVHVLILWVEHFVTLLYTMDGNHNQCEQPFLPICRLYINTVVDSDSI